MVEHNAQFRSYVPELDEFDEHLISSQPATYQFGRSQRGDYGLDQAVPLFLADPDGEPDPQEFVPLPRRSRLVSVGSKILIALVVAGGAAAVVAWFSPDAARNIIAEAKASLAAASATAAPSTAATSGDRQLTAADIQLKDPARVTAPQAQSAHASPPPAPAPELASAAPSREEISSAYQAALRSAAPAAPAIPAAIAAPIAPPAAAPAPQVKRIGSDELAALMKRAKDFLATGDIPAARLLLERAAEEGQDASAALLLARTYDPVVLGTSDVRNIAAEPEKARAWYQKAAQFGSPDAQQRLAQLDH